MAGGSRRDPGHTFRQEAGELLARLETALLEMEAGNHDRELLNEAFRALHTVKGSGAMFELDELVAFAHHFEDAFDRLRNGETALSRALIDCALRACDHLALLLAGSADAATGAAIVEELETLIGAGAAAQAPGSTQAGAATTPAGGGATPRTWRIVFYPNGNAFRFGTNPALLFDELRELGELRVEALTGRVPTLDELDASHCYLGWELTLETTAPREAIDEVFVFVSDDSKLRIEAQDAAPPGDAAPENVAPENVAPENVAPENVAPENVAPEDAAPGDAAPGDAAPGDAAPGDAAPEEAATGAAAPGSAGARAAASTPPAATGVSGAAPASPDARPDGGREASATPAVADPAGAPPGGGPGAPSRVQATTASGRGARPGTDVSESVRVAADRLDRLMDQVGELVIAQSRLADLAGRWNDASLRAVAEDIERLVTNLRDDTLGIRMVPIGGLFGKFRRVTRNLSRELGKEVEFDTRGEDTEVDKTFIEQLNDPLVHLIRNAMDHGLEDAQTRLAAGKPPAGRLRLSAHQAGGEVLVSITDDGRGLDLERIRTRAVERGLLGADQEIGERALRMMIFEPGFSTAERISNVSGRGVGMDVVRRTVEGLRGSIEVESVPGRGTRVTLRLPLTLAIIEGFHVHVGGGAFVLPLDVIEECVEISSAEDTASEGRSLICIRDQYVPFARLHDLFGFEYGPDPDRRVVVIRVGGERVGLVVDEIVGQRQTVIKPLSVLHRHIPGLAGATILGDGRVALIVDVAAVLHMARHGAAAPREAQRGAA